MAFLDNNGVLYFWGKVKSYVATAISNIVIPSASSTTPAMDGTAATGSSAAYARGDHVHPSDTTKVDKVTGKGLSTNDYTTTEKNKLSGIASGAQANVIETVKVNGTALTPSSKAVDVTVPTKTSDLTNDSDFITIADVPEGAAASTATPLMDGTAAVGTSTAFARGDHRHPSDSNKVDKVSGKGLSTEDYTTAEKQKLAAFGSASDYALKTDLTGLYKYKGSVATVANLPSSGNTTGDVYNVESSGMNYAWDGSAWDALGEIFTVTAITNAEIDTICT